MQQSSKLLILQQQLHTNGLVHYLNILINTYINTYKTYNYNGRDCKNLKYTEVDPCGCS